MADQDREGIQDPDQKFDVVFRGNLVDGYSEATVTEGISALFKLEPTRVYQLFKNSRSFLKRNINLATAQKIVAAMASVGAEAEIQQAVADESTELQGLSLAPVGADVLSSNALGEKPQPAIIDSAKLAALRVEPLGIDVLSADEKPEIDSVEVDLSHLKLED
jgi:hypothetical protein